MLLESPAREAASPAAAAEPRFLEAAAALGRRLCRDALWSGQRCNFLGDRMENLGGTWQAVHAAAGPDLYGGTAGIGLFLARLWSYTGEALLRQTALGAFAQARSRAEDLEGPAVLGFYSGLPGLAWAAAQAAELLDDEGLAQSAGEWIGAVAARSPEAGAIDLIGGSAGTIPALLDLAARLGRPELLEAAVAHGDFLLANAHDAGGGALSWDTLAGSTPRHLTGFGHGAAGIAWALSELAAACAEARSEEAARYQSAADAGVAYEQGCFSAEHGNWPDFRDHSPAAGGSGPAAQAQMQGQTVHALAWCHGAPGIGLGRLRGWQLTGQPELRRHAEQALAATRASFAYPAQGNFSLCHGNGGNAELAILAGQVLGDGAAMDAARAVGRAGVEHFHDSRSPWPCGVPEGGETPALMTGLAGIGYFYLRLYDPQGVPSVLIPVPKAAV